jgi:hypothetical protein
MADEKTEPEVKEKEPVVEPRLDQDTLVFLQRLNIKIQSMQLDLMDIQDKVAKKLMDK